MIRLKTAAFLFTLLLSATTLQSQDLMPVDFEKWTQQGMEKWEIPGMAIAVVYQGETIYTNGFGVRKLGEQDLVDEHTQFGIASVSKHMTATSLGLLVDEGVLNWHDPVREYLPWFELSDPWAARHVTLHDLLTHQVGVGRILGNRLQYLTNRSRYELMYRMRYHEFEEPFRSSHVYSNAMYTVAGEVAGAVSGRDWDNLMYDRLFRRLGMDRTNTSILELDESNAAWPHQYIEGEVVPIKRRNWDVASAAGGINSTAADMAKWMSMQLNAGIYNGIQIISGQTLRDIQTPKVTLPISAAEAPQQSYGYGYRITDYRGYRVLAHGGATDGMNTNYVLIPQLELGIIVMTNTFNNFMNAIPYHIIDHILGVEGPDWMEAYHDSYVRQFESATRLREEFEATRIPDTRPSHDLPFYTGRFHSDLYDGLTIREQNGKLLLTLFDDPELTAVLEHWHHNMFRVLWENRALREEFIHFRISDEGRIDTAEIRFSLNPLMLQVGAYPASSYRNVPFQRVSY
ncbi:MAG: serine hydrolase [Balneolaceae bacterium]|nr:MAG: serine hydrolase [Balneolaceae bacterium]